MDARRFGRARLVALNAEDETTDVLREGIEYLSDSLRRFAAQDAVVVRDGNIILETPVVLGATRVEIYDEFGAKTTSRKVDLIFFDARFYRPKRGDVIKTNGETYVATPIGDELWRYCDPQRSAFRVHAQASADDAL